MPVQMLVENLTGEVSSFVRAYTVRYYCFYIISIHCMLDMIISQSSLCALHTGCLNYYMLTKHPPSPVQYSDFIYLAPEWIVTITSHFFTHIFILQLPNSMEKIHFWEANMRSSSQNFPTFYGTRKINTVFTRAQFQQNVIRYLTSEITDVNLYRINTAQL
jgi:hypothetical protein